MVLYGLTWENFLGGNMKYLSIRVKLMILTLITLVPLVILQIINIGEDFQRSSEQKLEASVELAYAVSASFNNYIKELWIQESIIGEHITSNINDTREIQAYLESIVNNDDNNIQRLSWASPSGIIIANTRPYMIGLSIADRDYFKSIKAGQDMVISDLIESYGDGTIVVPVVRGIRKNGELLGIVVYSVSVDRLVANIPGLKLNRGDVLALVDRNGHTVFNSQDNNLSFSERLIQSDDPSWRALKGETVKIHKIKSPKDGSYRMRVEYPIKEIGWACSVSSDRDTVLEETYVHAKNSIISLIIFSIVSLLVSFVLGKKITEPLIILKSKADELKKGDYSVRANIDGYDEVASTAEAFDHMAESIEQYDKMKNQFFSNLSHEFKTPINVIYSSAQLVESFERTLEDREFKNRAMKDMRVIRQNCYRLIRLVDNMIDVTRYDIGNFRMNVLSVDIVNVVENVSLSVVKFAEQKGVTIIFDTDVEEKDIYCDPNMIERMLLNLISNSLKFTDSGGFIYINIQDGSDKIAISVRDTGIGMPKDKLSVIFDRFRQLDTSLSRNHEGSGLGLSIVKALVEAHEGIITVSSELGIGTEFLIQLPVAALCEQNKENDRALLENSRDTIQKIEVEFSDIYSIGND
jgi:signal transduction histidine kinase